MVEAKTATAEAVNSGSGSTPVSRPHISALRYYIHDSTEVFRFQLIGDLREADVKELSGCWLTAKTTFGTRKLMLDLQGLRSTDESGKEWLLSMVREGAAYLPDSFFRNNLSGQIASACLLSRKAPGFFTKLFCGFRGSRDIPAGSPTQAP